VNSELYVISNSVDIVTHLNVPAVEQPMVGEGGLQGSEPEPYPYLGVAGSLGSRQVDHEQPALPHGRRRPGGLAHCYAEQCVTSGRRFVHARRLYGPLPVSLV